MKKPRAVPGDKMNHQGMNQLDKDMYARQLAENRKELAAIMETDCSKNRHQLLRQVVL